MLELESVHLRSVDLLCDEIETVIRLIIGEFLELVQSTAGQAGTIQGKSDLAHIDLASVQSSLSSEQNWARLPYPGTLDTSCLIEPLSQMKSLLSRPFVRITFEDALHHLCERFGARHPTEDFTKEEERHIVQWFGESRPVFVTDFPASLKPFYCLSSDGVRAEAADLLFPDVGELVGGSVRETDESVLRQRLSTNSPELCANEWYCGLRGLGSAPHGGFGLGFERLLQILLGVHNIRDVTPFPRVMNKIVL
ncbi:tRNA ligase class II [Opisthorchis viverrini]|nr:tRNA ligase class II [Opisthorchis viverrini]